MAMAGTRHPDFLRRVIIVSLAIVLSTVDALSTAVAVAESGHTLGELPSFSTGQPDYLSFKLPSAPQTEFATPSPETSDDHVLPDGLLYRSYIAGPQEPRFGSVLLYDISAREWRWDAMLGGRVGLFRRDTPDFLDIDSCQIDLEGAAIPRLNPHLKMDVESTDFRFGLLWTALRDNVSYKIGYFHVSSHVGDEYLLKNPMFERRNFVRESFVFGRSSQVSPEVRTYGEFAWAFMAGGGAKPIQLQTGAEYAPIATSAKRGAPFSAINLQLRQEVGYAAGTNLMTGWQWKGPDSGRAFRCGLQYFNGPTNQYEFLRRYDNQLGLGVWFDY